MGSTHWGLGLRLVFRCIFLVSVAHKCVGGGNITTASCYEQERLALLKFKHSVRDDHGLLSSWGFGNDCCTWERVGCDDATGRVVSLHLRSIFRQESNFHDDHNGNSREDYNLALVTTDHYLVGDEVNSCLTELVNLKHLDLSGNDFQRSQIPKFIGSFKQLRYLNLSGAGFRGNIPHQIGNLSNLKVLDMTAFSDHSYESELMTDDMVWISGLSKLEYLDLSWVDLSKAQNLGTLLHTTRSLLKLILSACGLSLGHFSSNHLNSSRELASIKHLVLIENDFGGQLPALLFNMTSLAFLDFSLNDLSMAWSFENLLNMLPSIITELHLSGCKLNLSPASLNFSTHSNIQHLDLSYNAIKGKYLSVLTNMSSMLSLDLSDNILESSIPVMPNLLKLDISWNHFKWIDDVGIWTHCHLKELIVSRNQLEGEMIGPSTNVSKCAQNALEILYLDRNHLISSIPESVGRFTNLRSLDLSFNELTGPIPKALGKLRSLQVLYLSYNHLIGPIPDFHGQLTILHLAYNQLSGSIPESLGRLTNLTEIFLKSNRFTGSILRSIGRLTSLEVFSVSSNLLNGTIPSSIGQLSKLYIFDVSKNSLQGVVSEDHFADLSTLRYLNADYNNKLLLNISREWIPPFQLAVCRLTSCQIQDRFPQWIRTQRQLFMLLLSNNSIFGPLPTWLRLMPIISLLDLSHNKLTGPLTNLHSVYDVRYNNRGILSLRNNLFSGLIPKWLCTRKDLEVLDLSKNGLTGNIPTCLWKMPALGFMLLSSNRLSGVISSSCPTDSSLIILQLNNNNFSGELPLDVSCFVNLVLLDLGENKISGNIPEWIGENITYLSALRLHNNNFTGRIPRSLCKCQLLQILDLAHNNIRGSIPRCFKEFDGMKDSANDSYLELDYGSVMQVLKGVALDYKKTKNFVVSMDLSSNKLVGEIPEALTTLVALIGLNLSYNQFSGAIPKNMGNMKSLNSLDLSTNEFTGIIPPSISTLNFLSYLNLSHNNLSGQIPTGSQLQTLTDPSIYADNPYLCGAPLPKECFPHEKPPTTTSNKDENGNEPRKVWFYLDIMSGFATGFWGIIGVLSFKKQWRHKLFMFSEKIVDKIYVAVMVRVLKMKRGREAP